MDEYNPVAQFKDGKYLNWLKEEIKIGDNIDDNVWDAIDDLINAFEILSTPNTIPEIRGTMEEICGRDKHLSMMRWEIGSILDLAEDGKLPRIKETE